MYIPVGDFHSDLPGLQQKYRRQDLGKMSLAALITMIVVLGILWGGFLTLLALAVSKENKKRREKDQN